MTTVNAQWHRDLVGSPRSSALTLGRRYFQCSSHWEAFLVTASLFRTRSFGEFLLLRVLRFLPALVVVVAITAVVVGPLMTLDPLGTYFESPKFFSYFLNAFGYFEEQLPGLFADDPAPRMVNVSLWTIPWEFGGSIALYGLPILRVWWANWIVAACLSAMCAAGSWYFIEGPILRRKRQIIASILSAESASTSVAVG